MSPPLKGKTLFVTGASRGIGKAIALRAARDGANVIIAAKTAEPHPKLPGTIYSAAEEIEAAGGKALPLIVDVREEAQIRSAVEQGIAKSDGIGVNALWPRTMIATAAVINLLGGEASAKHSRKPEIMADAAWVILTRDGRECTGNFFIDDTVLESAGIKDFSKYAMSPGE